MTTKLRIVYDASAKQSSKAPCLNDCLYTGPNLMTNIMQLLLECRMPKIVLLADIEKAFLQVGLHNEDQDATRFWWLKDKFKGLTEDNIQMYRFRRVLFGATSRPFLLAATIRYHLKQSKDPIVTQILNKFYVDNLIIGKDNIEDAHNFYKQAKRILSEAGMNLQEWVSNCSTVIDTIPQEDRALTEGVKVLGIPRNSAKDEIHVKSVPEMEPSQKRVTKRLILQIISNAFDPLGLVSPVIRPTKVLIQELWKEGLTWDDVPPDELMSQWSKMNKQLSLLDTWTQLRFPRGLRYQRHPSCTCLWMHLQQLRQQLIIKNNGNQEHQSYLICSKSRVAPIKEVTIPRLELMAAVRGSQLAKFVQSIYVSINKVYLSSDSQVVLSWIIKGNHKQGVFVRNRVNEIKSFNFEFRYCLAKNNPANLPSRGCTICELPAYSLWWNGSKWLSQELSSWPSDTRLHTTEISALVIPAAVKKLSLPLHLMGSILTVSTRCNA